MLQYFFIVNILRGPISRKDWKFHLRFSMPLSLFYLHINVQITSYRKVLPGLLTITDWHKLFQPNAGRRGHFHNHATDTQVLRNIRYGIGFRIDCFGGYEEANNAMELSILIILGNVENNVLQIFHSKIFKVHKLCKWQTRQLPSRIDKLCYSYTWNFTAKFQTVVFIYLLLLIFINLIQGGEYRANSLLAIKVCTKTLTFPKYVLRPAK